MPAEIPEDVQILPSTTHRAWGTQSTLGPLAMVLDHKALFVVARRPSRTPDFAAMMAPVQMEMRYFNFG